MHSLRATLFSLVVCLLASHSLRADESVPPIAEFTEAMKKHNGLIPFYWDEASGSIYLEINQWGKELLYVQSLATGLGSNPVGLDRGKMGDGKIVRFERVGPKVLMVQRNLRFRANTNNALERRAVEESFAQSILWGAKVVAETQEAVLVDATPLLLSDPKDSSGANSVVKTLADSDQGSFSLDELRSAVHLPRCKAFPNNTELESILTFSGSQAGRHVRETTPTANSITLRQHHSFIKLPERGYTPREYDVRSPSLFITFADYATPLNASLQKRWIVRHRLQKRDPQAPTSRPIKPIIYYVDAGAPKQIQDALIDGARWWNEAFEAAGFTDAFQVKVLPPDADPLDVRYNVIQWVHRSTRGWSYGGSIIDPRTGEILKGHVTLGSLRVRQDQLLINGLRTTPANLSCSCCGVGGVAEDASLAAFDDKTSSLDVALARIRQLSAHEVGHTLGFMHNFAASTYGDRASVMDYPAPRVKILATNKLDVSDAYGVGIGEWDKLSVRFAYAQFPEGADERAALNQMLREAGEKGMRFISDYDARPVGAAQPFGNLWDNGSDPLTELRHIMQVRRIALDNFNPRQLPAGTSTADIAQYFTPLYLHHRYQLQAAGKLLGGSEYEYGYVEQLNPRRPIAVAVQRQALDELLKTIRPKTLAVAPAVTAAIAPRPYIALRDREILPTATGRIFDPLAAAQVAVNLTLDELLQHERLARLSIQSRSGGGLTPQSVLNLIVRRVWEDSAAADNRETLQLGRITRESLLDRLLTLMEDTQATADVRSAASAAVLEFQTKAKGGSGNPEEQAFRGLLNRRLKRSLERSYPDVKPPARPETPPGSPIGSVR